ncbi:MAG: hypothetical protein WBA13_00545 [Microcoleaceae cyanobacterium]
MKAYTSFAIFSLLLANFVVPVQATASVATQQLESSSHQNLLSARTSTHGPRRVGRGPKPYRYATNSEVFPHRGSGR